MGLSRSENMARIGARDTVPELVVRRALTALGVRYRLQVRTPGGKADLAIASKRFALFVDGCFWHGCPEHYVRPRTRNEFWDAKLRENIERDRRQLAAMDAAGWTSVRVWEHEVRENAQDVARRALKALATGRRVLNDWRVIRVEVVDAQTDLERRHHERLSKKSATQVIERVRVTRKIGLGTTRGRSTPRPASLRTKTTAQ